MIALDQIRFRGAIDHAIEGRRQFLADYLRNGPPLTIEQRHILADYIEDKLKRAPHRPRKRWPRGNMLLAAAAARVNEIKAESRANGRRYRIHWSAVVEAAREVDVAPDKLADFLRRSRNIAAHKSR
jgi:hypothetical protein